MFDEDEETENDVGFEEDETSLDSDVFLMTIADEEETDGTKRKQKTKKTSEKKDTSSADQKDNKLSDGKSWRRGGTGADSTTSNSENVSRVRIIIDKDGKPRVEDGDEFDRSLILKDLENVTDEMFTNPREKHDFMIKICGMFGLAIQDVNDILTLRDRVGQVADNLAKNEKVAFAGPRVKEVSYPRVTPPKDNSLKLRNDPDWENGTSSKDETIQDTSDKRGDSIASPSFTETDLSNWGL